MIQVQCRITIKARVLDKREGSKRGEREGILLLRIVTVKTFLIQITKLIMK